MRQRWIYRDGAAYAVSDDYAQEPLAPYVLPDIQPYQSMIDGSIIGSRSTHRAHIRQHGVVELGNEKIPARKIAPAAGLHERVVHEVNKRWR